MLTNAHNTTDLIRNSKHKFIEANLGSVCLKT